MSGVLLMRLRLCQIALAAALTAAAAPACGGGSGPSSSTKPDALAELPASDALLASAMHLAGDGRPVHAEFSWAVDRESFEIKGNGTYLEGPGGEVKLQAHYGGVGSVPSSFVEENDSTVIAIGGDAYVLTLAADLEWIHFTHDDLPADWDALTRMVGSRSPVSYAAIVRALGSDVARQGREGIRGQTYQRYSGTADANAIMQAVADAYGSQGQMMLVNRFSGPVQTDIWVDAVTSLPRRIRADGYFQYLTRRTHLTLTVDYTDFTSAVDVTAPATSTSFKDIARSS